MKKHLLFFCLGVFLTFVFFFIPVSAFAFPVLSDFNNSPSLDGWTCVAGTCSNPGTGGASTGNAGDGYLRYVDIGGSVQGDVLASSEFIGDYSSASGMTIEFDVKVFDVGGPVERALGLGFFSGSDTNLSGNEFALFNNGIYVDGPTDWIHVSVPLDFDSPGWNVRSGFDPSSVRFVRFAGDWVDGIEIIGYDNVGVVSAASNAVPEPTTIFLFATGLMGAFLRRRIV